MKYITRHATAALLMVFAVLPAIVMAQTIDTPAIPPSVTQYDNPGTTPTERQRTRAWRHSGGSEQQIAALGTTPVATFPIPVLFGIGAKDIWPNFGDPRPARLHEGEDIMALKGTPIVSPTPAVVLRAGTGGSEGIYVYTANPGGETFVYYHLDRIGEGVVSGKVLQRGSLIGYVGNTGDASGGAAHLHFEVHNAANTPLDPFPRLAEGEFPIQEKMSYLSTILAQATDAATLSQFLVTNFRGTFILALAANIALPLPIIDTLASIPASVAPINTGIPLPAGDLYIGSSGPLVVLLQTYLIQAASGVAASRLAGAGATGNFGLITKAALIEFQVKVGIDPPNGYYGVASRTFLLAHPLGTLLPPPITTGLPAGCGLPSGFSPLTGVPCATGVSATATPTLTRDLQIGMSGQDVLTLQKLLHANGYPVALTGAGSLGNETLFFGNATRAAVIKFQIARGITPAIGYVGPITRAALLLLTR